MLAPIARRRAGDLRGARARLRAALVVRGADDGDVLDAHGRLGPALRAWRDRRGLSLARLGELVTYYPSYLARLERAERFAPEPVARACDQALDAGGALLRLWRLAEEERQEAGGGHVANVGPDVASTQVVIATAPDGPAASEQEGIAVPVQALDGRVIWVSMPRRTFILGGLAAAATAAGPLATPTGASAGRSRIPPAEDVNPVEHLRRLRAVLVDSDNLLGPGHVLPTVLDHIRVIQQLRQARRGADRQSLLQAQAEFAEFAAWLEQDLGSFHSAQYWLDRALEWTHAAGDQDCATFVMARKSQLAGDMQDPVTAVDLAGAAANLARPHSRLAAVAPTYAALGHALDGDHAEAMRAIDEAREQLERLDDDPASPWAAWLDPAYIEVHRARCLSVLGVHHQAAAIFQQAIRELPDAYRRDRGVYLAREAIAHAGGADPEQAADVGLRALAIAQETGSGRITSELVRLNTDLGRWPAVPGVKAFREALAEVIPRQIPGPGDESDQPAQPQ